MNILYLFPALASRLTIAFVDDVARLQKLGHTTNVYSLERDEPDPYESQQAADLREKARYRTYGSKDGSTQFTDTQAIELAQQQQAQTGLLTAPQISQINDQATKNGSDPAHAARLTLDYIDLIRTIRETNTDLIYSMAGQVDQYFNLLPTFIPQPIVSFQHGFSSRWFKALRLEKSLPKSYRRVDLWLARRTRLDRLDRWRCESFGPIRVLFVVSNGHGFTCQYPIIQQMHKRSGIKVATTASVDPNALTFADKEQQDCYERLQVDRETALTAKWHYAFYSELSGLRPRHGAIAVTQNHGPSFGISDHSARTVRQPNVNLVLGLSRDEWSYHEKTSPGLFSGRDRIFFPAGFPKLDKLIQGGYSREDFLAELQLPTDRQTILITSHWTPRSLLRTFGADLLEAIAPLSEKYNIIQTAHGNIWNNPVGDTLDPDNPGPQFQSAPLWESLKALESRWANVRVIRAVNVLPLLNAADMLIGDVSSVLVEFSNLDRPILFFDNPKVKVYTDKAIQLYRGASTCFQSVDDLPALCEQALADPDQHKDGRTRLINTYNCHSGRSAEAIVNLIQMIGRISSTQSARWTHAKELSQQCINNDQMLLNASA